jgi:hypothetical protein
MMQAFGPWLPDRAPFLMGEPFLTSVTNGVPLPTGDYGPLSGIRTYTDALAAQCFGLTAGQAVDGTHFAYAGTASALYLLGTDGSWADRSKSGGYNVTDRWRFAQFGDQLIATPGLADVPGSSSPIQTVDPSSPSDDFADLSGDAPFAKYIAVVRDFVMVLNTYDPINGTRSDRYQWCGIGNPASWPTPGTAAAAVVQSDHGFLPDTGPGTGIVSGAGADALVFTERAVWRFDYQGPPRVFTAQQIARDCGCKIPGSLVSLAGVAYFYAESGWHACNGGEPAPIGAGKLDAWFQRDLASIQAPVIWAAADPRRKLILWAYVSINSQSGLPDRLLIFNTVTGQWGRAEIDLQVLGTASTPGYTLEDLDAFGTLETLPYPLDDEFWAGSGLFAGIVAPDGKLGRLSGDSLQFECESSEIRSSDGKLIFVQGVRPYVDGPETRVSIAHRMDEFSPPSATGWMPLGPDRMAPFRVSCRGFRVRVRKPVATSWTKASGYLPRFRAGGMR